MLKEYHIEICRKALSQALSAQALEAIIAANLRQDHLRFQFVHPHFHFDASTFERGNAYMEEQRKIIVATLKSDKNLKAAWQAFGKLTHAGQDFYAHSNYVQLWVTEIAPDPLPPPSQINPLDPNILAHPKLHSGKIYFWDWVAFIPGLHHLGAKMTPKDSHSNMNLDHPQRSPLFPYVLQAAIQRTAFEFNQIGLMLNPKELLRFTGK